jgi:hypothetical protein
VPGEVTLREAIINANNRNTNPGADVIDFAPGAITNGSLTILLQSPLPTITEEVVIDGLVNAPGNNRPVIKPMLVTTFRVFDVNLPAANATDAVDFYNLEITGGWATGANGPQGGGIKSWNADLLVQDCFIHGNRADTDGGGVWAGGPQCRATFNGTSTVISDNHADGFGGGIAVVNSYARVQKGVKVEDNDAGVSGGGIYVYADGAFLQRPLLPVQRILWLDGSVVALTISGNEAHNGDGGGVLVSNQGFFPGGLPPVTELSNTTISSNKAYDNGVNFGRGGGIAVRGVTKVDANNLTKIELNGQQAPAPATAPFKLGVYLEAAAGGSTFIANANVTNDNYQFS